MQTGIKCRDFITSGINIPSMTARFSFLLFLLLGNLISAEGKPFISTDSNPGRITVPIGGNTFLTSTGDDDQMASSGIKKWKSPESVLTAYVYLANPQKAFLQLALTEQSGDSEIEVSVGAQAHHLVIPKETTLVKVGQITLKAGYNQISFRGSKRGAGNFADIKALYIDLLDEGVEASFVKDNIDNRFYWGRRGPSVHLCYQIPDERDYEWFYSEITVPIGEDPEGSYYMANGFAEGYFGIQVNSPTERRVLFSVWSPFQTDDPKAIPEDQRIKLLKKGKDVYTGEFGNEGSGGQSFLRFPWITGNTYRFLNSVTPDGKGNTIYTAYFFAPEVGEWQLIASFLRPQTDTWYQRPHSFLENFLDNNGYKGRKAFYVNQWIRTSNGIWVELDKARFSADDIGRRGYRLDFAGGEEEGQFFLQNGGFFNGSTQLGSEFSRARQNKEPDIDFDTLEQIPNVSL